MQSYFFVFCVCIIMFFRYICISFSCFNCFFAALLCLISQVLNIHDLLWNRICFLLFILCEYQLLIHFSQLFTLFFPLCFLLFQSLLLLSHFLCVFCCQSTVFPVYFCLCMKSLYLFKKLQCLLDFFWDFTAILQFLIANQLFLFLCIFRCFPRFFQYWQLFFLSL